MSTMTTHPGCDYEHDLWGPHDGCKEFMTEPEATVRCDEPATTKYIIVTHTPWGDEEDVMFACEAHKQSDDLYTTVVSEEPVSP